MKEKLVGLLLKNNMVDTNDLVDAVETIALTCYGVVSLKNHSLVSANKKEKNVKECVIVSKRLGNTYKIKLYVSLMTGVKITEVLSEIQKRIKYEVENRFRINIEAVDVYVQTIVHEK